MCATFKDMIGWRVEWGFQFPHDQINEENI